MEFVSVCFSGGSMGKNSGCELAPDAICSKLKVNSTKLSFGNNIEEMGKAVSDCVGSKEKLFLIGGDHSLTYYSFKAFAEKNPNCGLLVFDAHPDMQSSDFVTHEDYLKVLIEKRILKPANIVLVGLREISNEERVYLREKRIVYFGMDKICEFGIKELCDMVLERMSSFGKFYLSIDIDAVDPAFAPGTGYLEPGGLTSSDLLYFLNRIRNMKNLGVVDLVEINPSKDLNGMTVLLGCRIAGVFL